MTNGIENNANVIAQRYHLRLIGHGSLVLLVGLIAGMLLVFSMLNGFVLGPIIDIPYELPGSVRGWKAAHVGGLTNGLLLIVVALAMIKLPLSVVRIKLVYWSLIATGWGNTLFYWGGNLSPNRGISFEANQYGETTVGGLIAFFAAAPPMLFTIIAMAVLAQAAFNSAAE